MVAALPAAEALACGDKFVVPGRRARFSDQLVVRRSAAVLFYVRPGSALDGTLQRASVEARLRKAGYRPTLVTSEPGLGRALRGGAWDVVVVELTDGPDIARRASSGPPTTVLPVVYGVERAALDQARQQYRHVLKSPSSDRAFLKALDAILAGRARATPARIGG
jgi:hypothetical protein